MITEKEAKPVSSKQSMAQEINQALQDAMQKAIAEKNWERLQTIVSLMRASNKGLAR